MDPDLTNTYILSTPATTTDLSEYTTLSPANTSLNNSLSINGSNINWGNSVNSYYVYDDEALSKLIILYLSEKDIENLLKDIRGKSPDESEFIAAVKYIIKHRHCSEEFILNNLPRIEEISKEELLNMLEPFHKADIKSGVYAQLALLLQLN